MDWDSVIKAAPDIVKAAAPAAAAIPITSIMKRMLGPAADEVAEMWRDKVRMYRYERQLKCVEKAERMARDAGFAPQPVPPKLLFPLLEGVSFEENEDLHTMWSALLANAASPENSARVDPGFIALLKELSAGEAALFRWMSDQRSQAGVVHDAPFHFGELHRALASLNLHFEPVPVGLLSCLQHLQAVYLVEARPDFTQVVALGPHPSIARMPDWYSLTLRAAFFMIACRAPQPKR